MTVADPGLDQVELVHAIPGRFRIRIPRLARDSSFAERVAAAAADHAGVRRVRVNRPSASLVVDYDPTVLRRPQASALLRHWAAVGRPGAVLPRTDERPDRADGLTRAWPVALAVLAFLLASLGGPAGFVLGVAVSALSAAPIADRAIKSARNERRLAVDQLDAAAMIALLALGDVRSAALMSGLIATGEEIRRRTARRSRRAMLDLHGALGRSAWLVRGEQRIAVPVEELLVGSTVVVYAGDLIPVDGVVERGIAMVDQKMLTGESRPVRKEKGSDVLAGTALVDGKLYVVATAVADATRAGWIIRALDEVPAQDTRAAAYANRVADGLVGPTFALAGLSLLVSGSLRGAASILIVDFATGIRLSAPTTIMATLTRAAADGVLIKSGRALEQLAAVDAILFDKTGTLTLGDPAVSDVRTLNGYSEEEILGLAAAAEIRLRHPAARALVRHTRALGLPIPGRQHSRYEPGLGVVASIDGREVRVGSTRFLERAGIALPADGDVDDVRRESQSIAWVAENGRPIGLVAYRDPPRPEAGDVIDWLRRSGVQEIRLVSGDEAATSAAMARQLGIDRVHAAAMPDDKAAIVRELKQRGHVVAVVGDGINDSPALALADVSISMSHGADVARETADVVLMDSDLWRLPHAMELARHCVGLIRENIAMVAAPNAVALVLGGLGRLSPTAATILNNGSSILAGMNGLRPLVRALDPPMNGRRVG